MSKQQATTTSNRGGWASEAEYERRKDEASAVWARQKARRARIAAEAEAAGLEADQELREAGIDIGEGEGPGWDTLAMMRKLQQAKMPRAWQVAAGLGDGSVVEEARTGERVNRLRTERIVPVKRAEA